MHADDRRESSRQGATCGDKENSLSPKTGVFGTPSGGDKLPENVTTPQPTEGDAQAEDSSTESGDHRPEEAKGRGGRPPVFDKYMKAKVVGLVTAGVTQRTAAAYVGISHSAISKAIRRDPEFAREMKKARAAARIHPHLRIVAASQKDWRAARELLKLAPPEPYRIRQPDPEEEERARREAQEENLQWLERTQERLSPKKNQDPTESSTGIWKLTQSEFDGLSPGPKSS